MDRFEDMVGKTLTEVSGGIGSKFILFTTTDGEYFSLYHQ